MDALPLRVLVVDDEKNIADTLALILHAAGHCVRTACCGEEAVAIVEQFDPQVVISDVLMPGMSGLDLALWLADNHIDCKVLLISGHATAFGMVEESVRRGYYHTIMPKPVHPTQILAFVASCDPAGRSADVPPAA